MTPGRRATLEVAAAAILLGGAFMTGLLVGAKHQDATAAAAQAQVDQLKGEARAAGQAAQQEDQQARKDQATVTVADAHEAAKSALTSAAKRELDRRLAALHGDAHASHPSPGSPGATGAGRSNHPEIPDSSSLPSFPEIPDNSELAATRAALAQAQVVIAAQVDQLAAKDQQIAARDKLIASTTASRDYWKADAEKSQETLRLKEIAAEAQASAQAKRTVWGEIKAAGWAAAIAYAAGRAH